MVRICAGYPMATPALLKSAMIARVEGAIHSGALQGTEDFCRFFRLGEKKPMIEGRNLRALGAIHCPKILPGWL